MNVTFNNFDEFLQYHVKLRKQIEEQREKIYELERELARKNQQATDYLMQLNEFKKANHGNE